MPSPVPEIRISTHGGVAILKGLFGYPCDYHSALLGVACWRQQVSIVDSSRHPLEGDGKGYGQCGGEEKWSASSPAPFCSRNKSLGFLLGACHG
mmetsp:Transcript_50206/g.98871  ORF Transcript_50206/g.98871 Transcript_50206/m.98871 type:complete len:94 (+) Transcript_50206:500-781(+)